MELETAISEEKMSELKKIIGYILEEPLYKKNTVAQILLFGSYATHKAVERDVRIQRDGTSTVYQSDFDILIILRKQKDTHNKAAAYAIEEKISKDETIQTPVSLLFESEKDMCMFLRDERYFYHEIVETGITLWQRGKTDIKKKERKIIPPERRKILALEDFNEYFSKIPHLLKLYKVSFAAKEYKEASFTLHRITENLFVCILLVFIRYNPKEHDLEKLLDQWISLRIDPDIVQPIHTIFPRNTPEEKHIFDLLKRAYIESRYYKDFCITKQELEILSKKIIKLTEVIEMICKKRIKEM